jgi:hypothetical protein
MCKKEGCEKRGRYGYKGGKQQYCRQHKPDSMCDLSTKTCSYEDCIKTGYYGYNKKDINTYCKKHMKKDMVNVLIRTC